MGFHEVPRNARPVLLRRMKGRETPTKTECSSAQISKGEAYFGVVACHPHDGDPLEKVVLAGHLDGERNRAHVTPSQPLLAARGV